MSNYQFETVDVPVGAYIGWGSQPGQIVTGVVTKFEPAGGSDFNGAACPQLSLRLVEATYSMNKEGVRTDFEAGEDVVINGGQASLKRALNAADLRAGDVVRIHYARLEKAGAGQVKVFEIAVARGAGLNTPGLSIQQNNTPAGQPAPFGQQAPTQQAAPFGQQAPTQQAPFGQPPF